MQSTERLTRERAIELARDMRKGRSTLTDIQALLMQRGFPVSKTTVARWVNPDMDERHRVIAREIRRREYRAANPGAHVRVWDEPARVARIRALREAGLTRTAIARVCSLDCGQRVTMDEVYAALGEVYTRNSGGRHA